MYYDVFLWCFRSDLGYKALSELQKSGKGKEHIALLNFKGIVHFWLSFTQSSCPHLSVLWRFDCSVKYFLIKYFPAVTSALHIAARYG